MCGRPLPSLLLPSRWLEVPVCYLAGLTLGCVASASASWGPSLIAPPSCPPPPPLTEGRCGANEEASPSRALRLTFPRPWALCIALHLIRNCLCHGVVGELEDEGALHRVAVPVYFVEAGVRVREEAVPAQSTAQLCPPPPSPGMHWKRGEPPPPPPLSRAPSLCPATVPLTASASLNGICNRQQLPPTALATSPNLPDVTEKGRGGNAGTRACARESTWGACGHGDLHNCGRVRTGALLNTEEGVGGRDYISRLAELQHLH